MTTSSLNLEYSKIKDEKVTIIFTGSPYKSLLKASLSLK